MKVVLDHFLRACDRLQFAWILHHCLDDANIDIKKTNAFLHGYIEINERIVDVPESSPI